FQTPGFSTIITGVIVALPALFIESALMTDLTSIGTLFAFVLVCGGVLLLPRVDPATVPGKRFKMPHINGQWIVPVITAVFLIGFRERVYDAIANLASDSYHEI